MKKTLHFAIPDTACVHDCSSVTLASRDAHAGPDPSKIDSPAHRFIPKSFCAHNLRNSIGFISAVVIIFYGTLVYPRAHYVDCQRDLLRTASIIRGLISPNLSPYKLTITMRHFRDLYFLLPTLNLDCRAASVVSVDVACLQCILQSCRPPRLRKH